MKITRKSAITSKENTMEISVCPLKYSAYIEGNMEGKIQDLFPELNDDEREFLISGITPEEWNKYIPNDEDEDEDEDED